MRISIVIGFRNREMARVERVLNSLDRQNFADFELIFVDYGSDDFIAREAAELVGRYHFAKYYYSDTRGWFWNRAHALNTGIKLASGELIVLSDIDLIFPFDYLQSVRGLDFRGKFYTFRCHYLPENADCSNSAAADAPGTEVGYVGMCAVLKEDLVRNSCFNEYFMDWGGEDDDLYARLEKAACKWQPTEVKKFPVLHQWHPNHSPESPTPWYLEMVNYLYSRQPNDKNVDDYGRLVESSSRQILRRIGQNGSFRKFLLFPHPLFQFNLFLDGFFKMTSGEFGQLEFPVQPSPPLESGRNMPVHTRESWNDFIMHFIGKNRPHLQDYCISDTDGHLTLFLQKK